MKKILFAMTLLPLSLWANVADEKALFALLMPQKTLSAHFTSVVKNERGEIMQQSQGQFYLKRPQQFRWETLKPEHTLIIADGKKVWNYDEALEQVTVSALAKTQKTPAILLSGSDDAIKQLFTVDKKSSTGASAFLLKPKKTDSELESLEMVFQNKNLVSMAFQDKLGFHTEIKFSQHQVNGTLKETLFQFHPPKGVDVVGAN